MAAQTGEQTWCLSVVGGLLSCFVPCKDWKDVLRVFRTRSLCSPKMGSSCSSLGPSLKEAAASSSTSPCPSPRCKNSDIWLARDASQTCFYLPLNFTARTFIVFIINDPILFLLFIPKAQHQHRHAAVHHVWRLGRHPSPGL